MAHEEMNPYAISTGAPQMRTQRRPTVALLLLGLLTASCGGGDGGTNPTPPPPPPPPTTGSLAVQVTGLTGAGIAPTVRVAGPGGFTRTLTSAATIADLAPGSYTVTTDPVQGTLYSYAPSAPTLVATVSAGSTATVTVAFAPTNGALQVTLDGLPNGVARTVVVTGPNGYTQQLSASTLLAGLAPGAYTATPAATADVGIGYAAQSGSATVVAGATATRLVTWSLAIAARSTADRTDENANAKVKFLYIVPSDGTDRALDTDGTMHRSISAALRWFATQTTGRAYRLDTTEGALDITFVRLPRTEAQMASYGTFLRDSLEKDLGALGLVDQQKLYLAFYDGTHPSVCGDAPRPPVTPGRVAAIYLKGLPNAPLPCAGNPLATSPTAAPGYFEFVMLHEMLHVLGIVHEGAPNAVNGHVAHDPSDLMYAGAQPWTPSRMDQGRTNYFNPTGLGGGITNLAASAFLLP
jgi:hypothetical protein